MTRGRTPELDPKVLAGKVRAVAQVERLGPVIEELLLDAAAALEELADPDTAAARWRARWTASVDRERGLRRRLETLTRTRTTNQEAPSS